MSFGAAQRLDCRWMDLWMFVSYLKPVPMRKTAKRISALGVESLADNCSSHDLRLLDDSRHPTSPTSHSRKVQRASSDPSPSAPFSDSDCWSDASSERESPPSSTPSDWSSFQSSRRSKSAELLVIAPHSSFSAGWRTWWLRSAYKAGRGFRNRSLGRNNAEISLRNENFI